MSDELPPEAAQIRFLADGSMESSIPALEDDAEIQTGSPIWCVSTAMLLFAEGNEDLIDEIWNRAMQFEGKKLPLED